MTIQSLQPSFYQILAAVPEQQLKDLQKLLMAACATIYHRKPISELKILSNEIGNSAMKGALALSSDVGPMLMKIVGGKNVDQADFVQSVKDLRAGMRYEIQSDRSIDYTTMDILRSTTAYLINLGEPALKKIRALVGSLGEPALTSNFVTSAGSQDDFRRPLEKIVQKMGGKGAILSQEQVLKLKEKSPAAHKEYLRLRRGFNEVWKDELKNYVFQSGKPAVDYQNLLSHFAKQKMEVPLDTHFQGLIDANGKLYTKKGKLINGVPGPGFTVVMNPNYDPVKDDQYVFTTVNPEGKISQYVYTVSYRKQANKAKFGVVDELTKVIDGMHQKWLTLMKKQDDSMGCVVGTALDFMYMFSTRVGGAGNMADGKATFGASTLQARHVKILPGKIIVAYKGKGGTSYKHVVDANASPEAKLLYNNMKRIGEGKDPRDPFWTYVENGKTKRLLPGQVNNWFKRSGAPAEATIHKIRHVKGTKLFNELLAKNEDKIFNAKKPLTQAQADATLKKLATAVGQLLGHVRGVGAQEKPTGATALGNYIDPSAILGYYERLNLRLPRALQKLAS